MYFWREIVYVLWNNPPENSIGRKLDVGFNWCAHMWYNEINCQPTQYDSEIQLSQLNFENQW